MTTGPRCKWCDAPLVEAGSGFMCGEQDCPLYGRLVVRIDTIAGQPVYEVQPP